MKTELVNLEEIRRVQGQRLVLQLNRLYQNSELMRNKLRDHGLKPQEITGLECLSDLPFTTKQEIHEWGWNTLSVPPDEITEVVSTSGTTGKLFYFPLTSNDLDLLATSEEEAFRAMDIGKEDKCQITVTLDHLFIAGLAYYLGAQKAGAMVCRVGPGNIERQLQTANILCATVMVGVPSFLIKLFKTNQLTGVRKLVLAGESIHNQNLELNALGLHLQELSRGAELFSSHGITEIGCSFSECIEHNGLHAYSENVITEVVDKNGRIVEVGKVGELVVTTLKIEAMPVIRYKTGDLVVRLPEQPCSCGRSGAKIGPVIARKDQTIKLKGTTIYPSQIQRVLLNRPEVVNYQVVVSSTTEGLDKVHLKIGASENGKQILPELKKAFRSEIRVIPDLEVFPPEEVERLLHEGGSRKARTFYDCRAKEA